MNAVEGKGKHPTSTEAANSTALSHGTCSSTRTALCGHTMERSAPRCCEGLDFSPLKLADILDCRVMIGLTVGGGVVGTTTAGTGQTTAGSIAHLLVDSGSTGLAWWPKDFPQRANHCASGTAHNYHGQRVLQISPTTSENAQITLDGGDVVRVILSVCNLTKRGM